MDNIDINQWECQECGHIEVCTGAELELCPECSAGHWRGTLKDDPSE